MRLTWSPLALRRAEEISDYIRHDDPGAAEAWLRGLFRVVERLVAHPDSGRVVPEVRNPTIREVLYAGYRVVYRRSSKRIEVVTVRHGRRQLDFDELKGRS